MIGCLDGRFRISTLVHELESRPRASPIAPGPVLQSELLPTPYDTACRRELATARNQDGSVSPCYVMGLGPTGSKARRDGTRWGWIRAPFRGNCSASSSWRTERVPWRPASRWPGSEVDARSASNG